MSWQGCARPTAQPAERRSCVVSPLVKHSQLAGSAVLLTLGAPFEAVDIIL